MFTYLTLPSDITQKITGQLTDIFTHVVLYK